MSRLFDALKEASRFRDNTTGTSVEGVWEALGIKEMEGVPPILDNGTAIVGGSGAAAAVLVADVGGASPGKNVLSPVAAQHSAPVGRPVIAALDKTARLIPNCMDPI